jgi:hypothetical protein
VVPPVPANYARFLEDASVQYSPPQVERIFAALCVLPTEINDAAAASTTARIKAFQQAFNYVPEQPMPSATGRLSPREISFLLDKPKCDRARHQNFYEAFFLWGAGKPRDINSPGLINAMNQKLAEPKLATNASVKDVRGRIPELREALKGQLVLTDNTLSDHLTKDLVNVLFGGR